ncbi:hypothetical protein B0T17DRAFT_225865 [Bombardia bombarda]|uniref:Uncharacterized protein n=1 Tax=Bombardia bombarda TaxID=252184 RepID=A0AA39XB12_9PEZI|nr:hypothetical protein B0T17DRAFT_225865 [Bombardia bombarda]
MMLSYVVNDVVFRRMGDEIMDWMLLGFPSLFVCERSVNLKIAPGTQRERKERERLRVIFFLIFFFFFLYLMGEQTSIALFIRVIGVFFFYSLRIIPPSLCLFLCSWLFIILCISKVIESHSGEWALP